MNNTDFVTVRKRLFFGEAISDQLKLNYGKVDNNKEKFRKILEEKLSESIGLKNKKNSKRPAMDNKGQF